MSRKPSPYSPQQKLNRSTPAAADVRLGDTITCEGVVTGRATSDGRETVTVECWAQNQHGEKVTTGSAVLSLPLTASSEVQA